MTIFFRDAPLRGEAKKALRAISLLRTVSFSLKVLIELFHPAARGAGKGLSSK